MSHYEIMTNVNITYITFSPPETRLLWALFGGIILNAADRRKPSFSESHHETISTPRNDSRVVRAALTRHIGHWVVGTKNIGYFHQIFDKFYI